MNYFQLQYMKLIRLSLVAETTLKIKDYNLNFKYKNFWINRALHYEKKSYLHDCPYWSSVLSDRYQTSPIDSMAQLPNHIFTPNYA